MTTSSPNAGRISPDPFFNSQLAVIGQRVIDFWPVLARKHPIVVATCEGGHEVEEFAGGTVLVISPERSSPHRRRQWTNRSVSDVTAKAIPALDRVVSKSHDKLVVFPYCSTFEMEAYGRTRPIIVAAIGADLKATLDDKVRTRSRLESLGIDVPDYLIVSGRVPTYSTLRRQFSARFIVQSRFGAAGIGTYEIRSDAEFKTILPLLSNDSWLVSKYAGDTTVNIHGLVSTGVEISLPSVQLTGIPELVGTRHGYCGNDFGAVKELPQQVAIRCRALAGSVGAWLKEEGYVGIFGVDLACDENRVKVLEVNPRLQGSSWLLADVEERSGKTPLIIKHVLAFLGVDSPNDVGADLLSNAAQGILHLRSGAAKYVSHTLQCGTYELEPDNKLVFRRRPSWPLHLSSSEVFLFGLPPQNAIIDSGAVSARFACSGQISDHTGRHLTPNGLAIVEAIQRRMELKPIVSPQMGEGQ